MDPPAHRLNRSVDDPSYRQSGLGLSPVSPNGQRRVHQDHAANATIPETIAARLKRMILFSDVPKTKVHPSNATAHGIG
jgi:hypothetical protein